MTTKTYLLFFVLFYSAVLIAFLRLVYLIFFKPESKPETEPAPEPQRPSDEDLQIMEFHHNLISSNFWMW